MGTGVAARPCDGLCVAEPGYAKLGRAHLGDRGKSGRSVGDIWGSAELPSRLMVMGSPGPTARGQALGHTDVLGIHCLLSPHKALPPHPG